MKKIFHSWYFIKQNSNTKYLLLIFLFTFIIFLANYKPDLTFSGWDNLHPEFQPLKYFFDKSLFGVWHESYGLGGLIANAPYTEIFRFPFYFLLNLFVGDTAVRLIWTLLMLFIGGVGFYFLSIKYFTDKKLLATSLSLFYMLNLGTVQNFFTPNESFSHFFAFLPLLVLTFFDFVKSEETFKKLAVKLLIVNVLATPSFYITPIFIVYTLILLIISISLLNKKSFLKIFFGGALILLSNLYWLLPYANFVISGKSEEVSNSLTYNLNTSDAILRNNFSTDIVKILRLQGLWFETTDNINGKNTLIMSSWVEYYQNEIVNILTYIPLIFLTLGLIICLLGFKSGTKRSVFLLFFISLIALSSTNPPFGFIVSFTQENIPVLRDIFRFSFTKFIVLYSFTYSILILIFLDKVSNYIKSNYLPIGFIIFTCILSFPIFTGNFFYQKMFVYFPKEYTEVSKILSSKNSPQRMLYFPNSPSIGWTFYEWGYRGSGFLWYFLNENILNEAFEIHSKYNTEILSEAKLAFYEGNTLELSELMDKYDIKYILFDKSIKTCGIDCINHFDKKIYKFKNSKEFSILFEKGDLVLLSYEPKVSVYENNFYTNPEITNSNNIITKKVNQGDEIKFPAFYGAGNFAYFNFFRDGNSISFRPLLPGLFYKNESKNLFDKFNFTAGVCQNCSDVILDNGVENIFISKDDSNLNFGFKVRSEPLIVYNGQGTINETIKLNDIKSSFQFCSDIESAKTASLGWQELENKNGVVIESRGISPCFSYKSGNNFENLTAFNFSYISNVDFHLEIAFINEKGNKEIKFFKLNSGQASEKIIMKLPELIKNPEIFFVIRPLNEDKEIEVSVEDILIESSFPKISEFSVPVAEDLIVRADKDVELVLDYSGIGAVGSYLINPKDYLVNNYKYCEDVLLEEIPEKRKIVNKDGVAYFNYSSGMGVTCETFNLPELKNTSPYLVSIVSENIKGSPMKACFVNNFQNYCLTERNLISRDEKFIFNRYSETENKVLQLSLINNFVTPTDERENNIEKINFSYVPIKWLEQISLNEQKQYTIDKANRIFPFLYVEELKNTENKNYISNFQSKENGWLGLCFGSNCKINNLSNNSWTNIWEVSVTNTNERVVFLAIYVPQIYLFFGLFLIVLCFILIYLVEINI